MERMLNRLKVKNNLTAVANMFLSASVEATIKNNKAKEDKMTLYAEVLQNASAFIDNLNDDLEKEIQHNTGLTRVIALQQIELEQLTEKVKRLEREIQFRDL